MNVSRYFIAFISLISLTSVFCSASGAADVDENVFNIELLETPKGQDITFYESRREQLKQELRRSVAKATSRKEYEKIEEQIEKAIDQINAEILKLHGYSESSPLNELAQACAKLQRSGAVDELNALLETELAKNPQAGQRHSQARFALTGATIVKAAAKNDGVAMRACADQLLDDVLEEPVYPNVQRLEYCVSLIAKHDPELADKLSDKKIEKFLESGVPALKTYASSLGAAERLANLPGSEMRMEGVLSDGTKLDWDSYRGKVVLIDFWATWCGPCRAELPNIKAMYEKYREAGFEVLGYSCDSDVNALNNFIKANALPWNTVSQKLSNDAQDGAYLDLIQYYAIAGIPKLILVDREGVVIDTDAKGAKLQQLLQAQFPEVR